MLKKSAAAVFVVAGVSVGAAPAYAIPAVVALEQYAFVIDGALSHYTTDGGTLGGAPAGVDLSGFDPGSGSTHGTGLGDITIAVSGPGDHYVGIFVDHEISEVANTFFNETGAKSDPSDPASGQTWEIDDPDIGGSNFILGDLLAQSLPNTNFIPGATTDVSMAMAYDFVLGADETAVVSFTISDVAPTSRFFLPHFDPGGGGPPGDPPPEKTIYLSGHVSTGSIPEPGTLAIFGAGLLALGGLRCARRQPRPSCRGARRRRGRRRRTPLPDAPIRRSRRESGPAWCD